MKTFSMKLPDALHNRLVAAARRRRQTKSGLARYALEAFLDHDRDVPNGSCLELAADLAGCVEGPGDLSNKKEHLHGYGQ